MKFDYMGLFDTDRVWIHPERTEKTYELIYNLKNDIFLEENGNPVTLKKGEVAILKSGVMHRGLETSEGPVSFYWIHFYPDDEECTFPFFAKSFSSPHLFRELMHYSLVPGANQNLKDAVLIHILNLLSYENSMENLPKVVMEALSYIRANATIELTAENTALHFSSSCEPLSRLPKKHCGVTLKALIDRAVINSAKNLLSNTNLSVKEISASLCFVNSNAFINFFKYHEGMSPTSFRGKFSYMHINSR